MPKIYTKQGDEGQTRLPGGDPIHKDAPPLEACGSVDELCSLAGLARAEHLSGDLDKILETVQTDLFQLNSELADPACSQAPGAIDSEKVKALEGAIDRIEAELPELTNFILPGGIREAAVLHVARTVCRRAERRVVAMARQSDQPVSPWILVYLNRLADLLFMLARAANARSGRDDIIWQPE